MHVEVHHRTAIRNADWLHDLLISWPLLKIIRKKKRNPQIYMLNEEISGILSETAMIMSRKTKKKNSHIQIYELIQIIFIQV